MYNQVGPSSYQATVLHRIWSLALSRGAMDAPRRTFPVFTPERDTMPTTY